MFKRKYCYYEILLYKRATTVRWNRQNYTGYRKLEYTRLTDIYCKLVGLEDLEEFLELDHERPVRFDEVVAEVILTGVDAGARNLKQRIFEKSTHTTLQLIYWWSINTSSL